MTVANPIDSCYSSEGSLNSNLNLTSQRDRILHLSQNQGSDHLKPFSQNIAFNQSKAPQQATDQSIAPQYNNAFSHQAINGTSQCSEAKVQVRNFRRFWTLACHMSQLCLSDGSHGVGLTKLYFCCIQGYILSKHFTSMTPSLEPVNVQRQKCK